MNQPGNSSGRARRVLAIDPGFDRMGAAVIEGDVSKPVHIWSDCVTPPPGEPAERLAVVYDAVDAAIRKYRPLVVAIEGLYFSKNVKTALGVAEARGAVLAAAGAHKLFVIECQPADVKLAVTGHGRADKKAIALMVPKLIDLPKKRRLDDELDAIALGICALPQLRRPNTVQR